MTSAALPRSDEPAIDRLVRSARECYRIKGVRGTRMSDVAAGAGLARQTAYDSVKGNAHLLQLAIQARIIEMGREIEQLDVDGRTSVLDRIVERIAAMVRKAGRDPEFTMLAEALPRQEAARFMSGPSPVTDVVVDLLRPLCDEALQAGLLRTDASFYEMAVWLQTMFSPLAAREQDLDDAELDRFVRLFVLPGLLGAR